MSLPVFFPDHLMDCLFPSVRIQINGTSGRCLQGIFRSGLSCISLVHKGGREIFITNGNSHQRREACLYTVVYVSALHIGIGIYGNTHGELSHDHCRQRHGRSVRPERPERGTKPGPRVFVCQTGELSRLNPVNIIVTVNIAGNHMESFLSFSLQPETQPGVTGCLLFQPVIAAIFCFRQPEGIGRAFLLIEKTIVIYGFLRYIVPFPFLAIAALKGQSRCF